MRCSHWLGHLEVERSSHLSPTPSCLCGRSMKQVRAWCFRQAGTSSLMPSTAFFLACALFTLARS